MRIAGYTYCADTFCPLCICEQVEDRFESEERAQRLRRPVQWRRAYESPETFLDRAAELRGIDRYDEHTYDSGDFPKVVFSTQIDGIEHCGQCGTVLI